jgi:tetrahydromethanopterin S-methyltransferase subunit G
MSDDPTRNLLTSFEERVLAEFAQLNSRLSALEEKVDARLHDTRPLWENVQQRLTGIEAGLNNVNRQLRAMIADIFQLRVRVENLEDEQAARER